MLLSFLYRALWWCLAENELFRGCWNETWHHYASFADV